jgi:hypothetical protein
MGAISWRPLLPASAVEGTLSAKYPHQNSYLTARTPPVGSTGPGSMGSGRSELTEARGYRSPHIPRGQIRIILNGADA